MRSLQNSNLKLKFQTLATVCSFEIGVCYLNFYYTFSPVTRITSSKVVSPVNIFLTAASRSTTMPSAIAAFPMSSASAFSLMTYLIFSFTSMTSKMPVLPR